MLTIDCVSRRDEDVDIPLHCPDSLDEGCVSVPMCVVAGIKDTSCGQH